ncbi:MAG: hypothetical protein LBS52_00915 [Dysgonamonadaceae bacterium]|jgi:TonB-dependent SusC/RagA subfamily outer membrane receptor|nr:hypothetical protein [Dysgonamonadaceae bacterium]
MENFLFYLLRASVCMVLFYGFYKLFLSRTTFYAANRLLLTLILLMVVALPLFRYRLLLQSEAEEIIWVLQPVETAPAEAMPTFALAKAVEIPWVQVLAVIYLVGLMFVIVRYVCGVCRIRRIIASAERRPLAGKLDLCISDKLIAPFSWMRQIVLSRADFVAESDGIINHEKSHALQKHSWDRLLSDVFACFFWFNPFSWLLRREIQSVHEFQADEYVLKQGVNAKQYQLLLIRKSVGEHTFALANNFLQRDLQKRIKMMIKNKTNPKRQMAYLALLPVILLGITLLSVPKLNAKEKLEENLPTEKEIAPSDTVPPVKIRTTEDPPLLIIDGKEVDGLKLEELDPQQIESISILKDKARTELYGEKGKNGVVLISTKNGNLETDTLILKGKKQKVEKVKFTPPLPPPPPILKTLGTSKSLIILDGKEISNEEAQKLSPEQIESISVLKDKTRTELYGEKGKNGVILISTKNGKSEKTDTLILKGKKQKVEKVKFTPPPPPPPPVLKTLGTSKSLIILDGKEVSEEEMQKLSPDDIQSFSVLKDSSATKVYGEKGKNGVIIIEMKKK